MSQESKKYGVELTFRTVVHADNARDAVNWANTTLCIRDPRSDTLMASDSRRVMPILPLVPTSEALAILAEAKVEVDMTAVTPEDMMAMAEAEKWFASPEANQALQMFEDEKLDTLCEFAHSMGDVGFTIDQIIHSLIHTAFGLGYDKRSSEDNAQ